MRGSIIASPWGEAKVLLTFLGNDILYVCTVKGGHPGKPAAGGFLFSEAFAGLNLSSSALLRGTPFCCAGTERLCYEAETEWAMPWFELRRHWKLLRLFGRAEPRMATEPGEFMLTVLSAYHADYLIERGITPLEPQHTFYLDSQRRRVLIEERNPEVIVVAHTRKGNIVYVQTGDGHTHIVSETSWALAYRAHPGLVCLADLEVVNLRTHAES